MSIPEALTGFFYNNGEVNADAVLQIMPDTFRGTPEQFAFRVASTFKLDSNFIEDKFEFLNLRTLFIINRVNEEIVMNNYITIAEAICEELALADDDEEEDIDLTIQLMMKKYSSRVYDAVFGEVFNMLDSDENVDPGDPIWYSLNEVINDQVGLFGHSFVMRNIAKNKFNLLNAALIREDMEEDAFDNIGKVSLLNIYTVLSSFEALPNNEEDGGREYTDSLTQSRERFLTELLSEKLKDSRRHR